ITTIATLKCLGASSGFIFRVHYLQVLFLALAGSLIGLILGVGGSAVAAEFLSSSLPVPPELIVTPGPLLLALAYGLLTATLFTIWPLARARETPAAALFRDIVAAHQKPKAFYLALLAICFLALVALAILTARETWFAFIFTFSIIGIFGVLILVGYGIRYVARKAPRPRAPSLRLAISNLYRPGAATISVVLSMGLGLTLFVTVALIEGNLREQVQDQLPDRAPAFFFIDIQSNQLDDFVTLAEAIPDVSEVNHVPNMRGRIGAVAGGAGRGGAGGALGAPRGSRHHLFGRAARRRGRCRGKLVAGRLRRAAARQPGPRDREGNEYRHWRYPHRQRHGPRDRGENRQFARDRLVEHVDKFHPRVRSAQPDRRAAFASCDRPRRRRGGGRAVPRRDRQLRQCLRHSHERGAADGQPDPRTALARRLRYLLCDAGDGGSGAGGRLRGGASQAGR